MRQIYDIIDLPLIIETMRARYVIKCDRGGTWMSHTCDRYNTEFEPPVSVLFSEQSTFIKEQLDFCLDAVADLVC